MTSTAAAVGARKGTPARGAAAVAGGRGPGGKADASPGPARTVGFQPSSVNERLLFASQLLIGYTVQVQVGAQHWPMTRCAQWAAHWPPRRHCCTPAGRPRALPGGRGPRRGCWITLLHSRALQCTTSPGP